MDVALIENQVGFQFAGIADLAERLARLEPLADRLLVRRADDLAVAVADQSQFADLLGDLGNRRLEILGELFVLLGLGTILQLGAL